MTIHDLARELKVSPATISRALNNGPVSAATRERVLRAVRDSGFVPDQRAQQLRRSRPNKVGVIVPSIANPVYPRSLQATHDILKQRGFQMILGSTYGQVDEERELLELMRRERVAGLLISTCEGEDDAQLYDLFTEIREQGIYPILLGKRQNGQPLDVVTVDNVYGAQRATEYLLRTGRRRLGFLAGRRHLRATEERLAGFHQALAQAGLEADPAAIVCQGDYAVDNGQRLATELLAARRVDALLCGNDLLAIGALLAAAEARLRVPDELAIVGFDDIPAATWVTPRLTTVRQFFERTAETACDLLFDRLDGVGPDQPVEILLQPELVVRESA